jgi:hypothetical protein
MRAIFPFAALILLAGCALDPIPELELACQTKKCICTPQNVTLLRKMESVPVEWKANGDAYCPSGYVLRLEPKDE